MLIHYSLASFELLERKMTVAEKEELFDVFNRVGLRMGLKGLPKNYNEWVRMREDHLHSDLVLSDLTIDLFKQYRKHLGWLRYKLLIESQKLVVPSHAKQLLKMETVSWINPILFLYKISRKLRLDWFLKSLVLPNEYKKQIKELDIVSP